MIGQAEAVSGAQELSDADASSFASYWRQFTAIWPAFLSLESEISEHASRWSALAEQAYAAGDVEGFRALSARAAAIRQLEADRSAVAQTVAKFKDAWDTLWSYIQHAGRWLGLQGLAGLGIPPLLLLIGIPTLVGALAWVVQKYFEIRQGLDYDLTLLRAAEEGRLTPAQIQQLQRPEAARGGEGLSWPLALAVVGIGLVALTMLGGRR